jgi:hypothetical protein
MARIARCSAAWTCSSTNGAGRSRGATVVARDAGWDDALDRIVAEVRRAGLTNDKACALGQFARVALRTPSIDYSGAFLACRRRRSPPASARSHRLGYDSAPDSPRGLIRARATSGLGQ